MTTTTHQTHIYIYIGLAGEGGASVRAGCR